ncbi:MAG: efflux RND transporter periplasmic adaptor subunit [Acidobacteria bacterium]|nr:MAG: efflux RND transporter periplasmic adaptor subunit [Acidobacteriota bacterium]
MKSRAGFSLIAFLVVSALSISCARQSNGTTEAATTPSGSAPKVEVTRVIARKLTTLVELPGQLVPYEVVDIYAKETGFIKRMGVDRGSQVKKGELIAQLEAPELMAQRSEADSKYQGAESQLLAAEARLAADEATYERMEAASKVSGVVAGNDLNVAQKTALADRQNVAAFQKNVQAAQDALQAITQLESYLKITAPFDGQITTRYVHPGALVGPQGGVGASTPIVRIETLTRLRLVVPVPEYDAGDVPEGTVVNFAVPSFPGKTFQAPIARISHEVDIKTRTMPVELDLRDPRGQLIPGTFCQVEWPVYRNYLTLFVPSTAVASDLARTFVIRVQNNRTEWVDVKTGATVGKLIEVFGDLKEGDEVAAQGTDQLRPGVEITAGL